MIAAIAYIANFPSGTRISDNKHYSEMVGEFMRTPFASRVFMLSTMRSRTPPDLNSFCRLLDHFRCFQVQHCRTGNQTNF